MHINMHRVARAPLGLDHGPGYMRPATPTHYIEKESWERKGGRAGAGAVRPPRFVRFGFVGQRRFVRFVGKKMGALVGAPWPAWAGLWGVCPVLSVL